MHKKILDWLGRPDAQPWPGVVPAEPAEPYKYRNPYPPPAGRRVRAADGTVWTVQPDGALHTGDGHRVGHWGAILAEGPVELLELTDAERASEALYGPVGARWGHPGTPCNYPGCALDAGHGTVHRDKDGNPLDVTERATETYVDPPRGAMLSRVCTCGVIRHTATQHEPGCARYVTPRDVPPPPVEQTAEEWLADKGMVPGMIVVQPDESGHPGPIDPIEPAPAKPRGATKRTNAAGTRPTPPAGRKRAPRKGTGS